MKLFKGRTRFSKWWAKPIALFAWPVSLASCIARLSALINPISFMIVYGLIFFALLLFTTNIEHSPPTILMP